ncbi:MAG: dihydrolipoyllysine-residue succinyltransferase [Buchnera aphidicola (Pentalonia nigronervosa)]|uniref:Dihydrolipoyllysine-residue succinyltransferase n=1 Tax=Buchnera aphidicola (Pentalonia nigronervosa) TaxID=1309793 RepID=A0A7H1AZT6_9GAMM|nr:MAG: dihydrolipoyllysine-residue succinyltransferase [Buchnera aphidicola (Pentalonia nigronervosa)]
MKTINILVPDLPESVNNATVSKWHKTIGSEIYRNDNIVDIETDKIMLAVSSPCNGILIKIFEKEGEIVQSQQILGIIQKKNNILDTTQTNTINITKKNVEDLTTTNKQKHNLDKNNYYNSPSIRRLKNIKNAKRVSIEKTKNKADIKNLHVSNTIQQNSESNASKNLFFNTNNHNIINNMFEKRVKMTRLRQRIAERLLESQKNTAMLTTFNEVNMQSIMLLRKKYGEIFQKKHGIRMGFMPFYVKSVVYALKKFPEINAYIDKTDIVYYKNFDINIAISTPRGLIAPVLKNADSMSMAEIEKKIQEFSIKGFENNIHINELTGGNFTITNGGVFGALLSTPIINPPQTAILGIHLIHDRPMAVNGKITILPMMYLALSYDHRLIDGKESINFLSTIKNILEDFNRILIDV